MFCFWASFVEDVSYLGAINAKGFTPDWHVISLWFDSSTQMEMLQKITDCESLENFPENVYDGVCFNKIASLCCTNCISTITRMHHRFFFRICSKNCMPGSTTEVSSRGLQDSSLQNFVKVSAWYLCHSLSNKVTGLQSIGCNFAENEVFDKNKN